MSWRRALRKMVLRILAALLLGAVLIVIPLPATESVIALRSAIVSFLIVVYIGKTIYDTLFYSRYIP